MFLPRWKKWTGRTLIFLDYLSVCVRFRPLTYLSSFVCALEIRFWSSESEAIGVFVVHFLHSTYEESANFMIFCLASRIRFSFISIFAFFNFDMPSLLRHACIVLHFRVFKTYINLQILVLHVFKLLDSQ